MLFYIVYYILQSILLYFIYVGLNLIKITHFTTKTYIGVRVGARAGYVIPGRDGNGGWRFEEILPPPPPSSSPSPSAPKGRFWVKIYEICLTCFIIIIMIIIGGNHKFLL